MRPIFKENIFFTQEWLQHCGIQTEDVQFTEESLQKESDSKLVSYQVLLVYLFLYKIWLKGTGPRYMYQIRKVV